MSKIAFFVTEFAEAYALKTLKEAIANNFLEDELVFIGNRFATKFNKIHDFRKILGSYHAETNALFDEKPDIVISAFSDLQHDFSRFEKGPFNHLSIDAAILKASKQLSSKNEKNNIKKEFFISNEKQIVVFGNVPHITEYFPVETIKSLLPKYQIILSSHNQINNSMKQFSQIEKKQIKQVKGYGKLAKLYEIADATINCNNLELKETQLNNFYEQTANGPTFMVTPTKGKQYGFDYCVKNELVHECTDAKDIVEKVHHYLENPNQKKHLEKRQFITAETRKNHLPKIVNLIKLYKNLIGTSTRTYVHPESKWKPYGWGLKNSIDVYEFAHKSEQNTSKLNEYSSSL